MINSSMMFRVLPFIAASTFLPEVNPPVEIWSMILRSLDPVSLLTAIATSPLWMSICRGDPILSRRVRDQIKVDKIQKKEVRLNPCALIRVERSGSNRLFGASQNKTVNYIDLRKPYSSEEVASAFNGVERYQAREGSGPMKRQHKSKKKPYPSMRC